MGGVLDDHQPVPVRDRGDRFHVAGEPPVVQDDYGLRLRADCRLEVGRIEVQLLRPHDVDEDRLGAGVTDCVGGGDEVERRDEHLVARPASNRQKCQVQSRGAVRHGDRVAGAAELGELPLELLDAGAHAPPARLDGLQSGVHELVVDDHVGQRHSPLHERHAACLTE